MISTANDQATKNSCRMSRSRVSFVVFFCAAVSAVLDSSFDGLQNGCVARGWVSGPGFTGPPLHVRVQLDGQIVASGIANVTRPVAKKHGFEFALDCAQLSTGRHRLEASAQDPAGDDPSAWQPLKLSPRCTQDGIMIQPPSASCAPTPPPAPTPPTPPPPPGQRCSMDLNPASTYDCRVEGRFTCNAQGAWTLDGVKGTGAFGYCQRSPLANSSSWRCCQERDPNHWQRPAAPPVVAPDYPPPPSVPSRRTPNVVLFLTDDEDVKLGSLHAMNRTRALMQRGGTMLRRHYVTTPICCPSRISLLSGRYAHNTGAISGTKPGWCAVGEYWKAPMQNHSLPTWIKGAGLTTGIFGKELNVNDDTYISPGWDRFFVLGGSDEGHYYHNWFNDQGARYQAGADEYMTDIIANRSLAWMSEQLEAGKPFFAYIAPHAPHTRATPAPGTDGYFVNERAPRTPAWNTSNEDKHWLVASQPPISDVCARSSDELYRDRLRALLGVDRLVGQVADLLMQHNALDDTYIIYTSDHGFHLGEFRMPYFKAQPYDTDINVPMMVRGPGVRAGVTIDQIGLNIDVGPTIADFVGTTPPPEAKVDGVSLVPLLLSRSDDELAAAAASWRKDFMFEFWGGADLRNATTFPPPAIGGYCHRAICSWNNTYVGVRTEDDLKYVEFRDLVNFTEYYNISRDPYELRNAVADTEPVTQQAVSQLRSRLAQLRNCSGEECH